MVYDCAIIGGGLGGLALSILLAQQGHHVILFEKETYPFHKVCGEYISMESWNFMKELGLTLRLHEDKSSMEKSTNFTTVPHIRQLRISACNGILLTQALKLGGFGISRYSLDNQLVAIARKIGVLILENTKVDSVAYMDSIFTISANHVLYQAKIVCGAYGKRSNIDVKLQRNFITTTIKPTKNFIAVKYHVEADLPKEIIELHNFKDGYCGISSVDNFDSKNRFCLCYLTTAKNLQANNNKLADLEKNVLMKNPFLNTYLSTFEKLYDKPLVISQINFEPKHVVENHILMVGDAAGMITPLCGNGMSMALHAAKLLSPLIDTYLEEKITRNELEIRYQHAWHNQFGRRVYAGRLLQKLVGNEHLTNITISGLQKMPFLMQQLVRLTHGNPF